MSSFTRRSAAQLMLAPLLTALPDLATAQDKPAPSGEEPPHPALPPEVVTRHSIGTRADTLSFRARAGAIPIKDTKGATTAELTYVSYETEAADPATRPIVFAVNGGPGAASAWLGLGAVGPWRLRMDVAADIPSAEPRLIENAETWLPFADLVLIDTPGTGYSWAREPANGQGNTSRVYSVDGDIEAIATFIREWLMLRGRLASPKYILAESYGGIRAPRLAQLLAQRDNVGIKGLFLVSPLLATSVIEGPGLLVDVARLPAYAAIRRRASGRAALADVETYARGEFLVDLLKGPRDSAAQDRLAKRVSALIGLSDDYVRTSGGRVSRSAFIRESTRASGRVLSNYDGTVTGWDPTPTDYYSSWDDPMLDNLRAPLGAAMTLLVVDRLQWPVRDARYEVLSYAVSRRWDWGKAGRLALESISALRQCLASDPTFRVTIVHGLNDMVTPYFATQLVMDSLPAYGATPRVTLATYAAGHMPYSDDAGRKGMRDEARALIATAAR